MPIGAVIKAGGDQRGAKPVLAARLRGRWVQANDDLETAEAAGDLLKPWNVARAAVHWVEVPEGAGFVLPRLRNDAPATTFTTDPVVRLIGAYGTPNSSGAFSGTVGESNHATFVRLDNVDSNAAGVTLDGDATANLEDASYEYSDIPNLTGYALLGSWYVAMLVQTAANVTGGASHAVYGDLLFLT